MLLGNLDESLAMRSFPEKIGFVLKYLKQTNFLSTPNGRYVLDGNDTFINIFEYQTKEREMLNAEVHRKYLDIHFVIEGKEIISVGHESTNGVPFKEYSESDDAALYQKINDEIDLPLVKGNYLVLFPGEVHKPGIIYKSQQNVRKAVVKLSIKY